MPGMTNWITLPPLEKSLNCDFHDIILLHPQTACQTNVSHKGYFLEIALLVANLRLITGDYGNISICARSARFSASWPSGPDIIHHAVDLLCC